MPTLSVHLPQATLDAIQAEASRRLPPSNKSRVAAEVLVPAFQPKQPKKKNAK